MTIAGSPGLTDQQLEITQFHKNIYNYVEQVDLEDVAVLTRKCSVLGSFALVPICGSSLKTNPVVNPEDVAAYDLDLPLHIRFSEDPDDYANMVDLPHIDTPQAIGLAKNDRLLAVLGFRFSVSNDSEQKPQRALSIIQIQDATKVRRPRSRAFYTTKAEYDRALADYYHTGLHDGLDWKATLVQSCESVGNLVAANQVNIQSHQNNLWPLVQKRGHSTYDGVAQQLGYSQLNDNNWRKLI